MVATSSMRCSTPGNVSRARPIASSSTPIARAAASRPRRSRGCGHRGSAAQTEAGRRPRTRSGARRRERRNPRGTTATSSGPAARRPRASAPRTPRTSRGGRGGRARGWSGSRRAAGASPRPRAGTTTARTRSMRRPSTAPTSDVNGRPMFPATSAFHPAASSTAPSNAVVVVFPFVPVTPISGFDRRRAPSSISEIAGMPRARAAATGGASAGTPGLFTTRPTPSRRWSAQAPA